MQQRLNRRTILATTGAAAALTSTGALAHWTEGALHAHDAVDAWSSFVAGAAHPLTGLDHLLAMVSVGLWSTLSHRQRMTPGTKRSMLAAPLAFALTLLMGAVLGLSGGIETLPSAEPMIAASLLVMGLLVSTRAQLPTAFGAALVATFALFHGWAHGHELTGHAFAALAGMILSTAALHALGIGLGLAFHGQSKRVKPWLSRAVEAGLGAGVALFGLSLLTPAVASVL